MDLTLLSLHFNRFNSMKIYEEKNPKLNTLCGFLDLKRVKSRLPFEKWNLVFFKYVYDPNFKKCIQILIEGIILSLMAHLLDFYCKGSANRSGCVHFLKCKKGDSWIKFNNRETPNKIVANFKLKSSFFHCNCQKKLNVKNQTI